MFRLAILLLCIVFGAGCASKGNDFEPDNGTNLRKSPCAMIERGEYEQA